MAAFATILRALGLGGTQLKPGASVPGAPKPVSTSTYQTKIPGKPTPVDTGMTFDPGLKAPRKGNVDPMSPVPGTLLTGDSAATVQRKTLIGY